MEQNPTKLLGYKEGGILKLSTKGRYGLRALLDVAIHGQEGPVPISDIAGRQQLSEAYLEQLMAKLKKAGLIESQRGAQGGYRLARPAEDVSVGDILRALEGNLDAVACPALNDEGGCAGAELCVTKYVWQEINLAITRTVDEIKLSTLVNESLAIRDEVQDKQQGAGACSC